MKKIIRWIKVRKERRLIRKLERLYDNEPYGIAGLYMALAEGHAWQLIDEDPLVSGVSKEDRIRHFYMLHNLYNYYVYGHFAFYAENGKDRKEDIETMKQHNDALVNITKADLQRWIDFIEEE